MKVLNKLPHRGTLAATLVVLLTFSASASAQFWAFRSSGVPMQIYTMGTNGAASVHDLTMSISRTGAIAGSGRRFDVAASGFNATRSAGTSVSFNSLWSKLGKPVVVKTNHNIYYHPEAKQKLTNTTITQSAAASLRLTDGTRFKGIITKSRYIYQYWAGPDHGVMTETNHDINTSITGTAVRWGRVGFGNAYQ